MASCLVCLDVTEGAARYHSDCVQAMFGTAQCPTIDLGGTTVSEIMAQQSNRMSISGVQDKLLVELSADRGHLKPADGGRYILKTPVRAFAHLPENEHLTMNLARLAGLRVPSFALLEMGESSLGYIVKRFDRTDTVPPKKRRQEDFCSLTARDPGAKYNSTAEECADVVRRHTRDAESSVRRLFLQFVFAFWVGNDDLHLKNLSLSDSDRGAYSLSLAYDLVCTRLYPQLGKEMALPINGRDLHIQYSDLLAFGTHCGITAVEAEATIEDLRSKHEAAEAMIRRSALTAQFQDRYAHQLRKKNKALAKPEPRRSR